MNEIKFKGKRVDNGEWVYGDLITCPDTGLQDCILELTGKPRKFIKVDPKTVGQYSGLKNKNDKEIYGGDILSNGLNCVGVVKYKNAKFVVDMLYNDGQEITFNLINCIDVCDKIGNIHDNPELLEDKK